MDKLTIKQEKFIVNVFSGMNQRESYIDAYHPESAQNVIDVVASQLLSNPKIQIRLAELQAPLVNTAIANEMERQERLTLIYRTKSKKPTPKEVIMAITEHNKMTKVYTTVEAATTVVSNFLFILSDGTRVSPKELMRVEEEGVTPP